MRYTPVELRHVRVGRSLFGYKRHDIDKLLEDVADSFEEVWSERGELADRLEELEKILADVKQREALLAATLVSAERAAADAREQARKEAELIVAEAHREARSVSRGAQGERDRLFGEVRRVETLLRAALGLVEETKNEPPPADESGEHWPKREDTREFQAIRPEDIPPQPDEPQVQDEPEVQDAPKLPSVQSVAGLEDEDSPSEPRGFTWG
jgi:cell division septum initiation protein DivIVA